MDPHSAKSCIAQKSFSVSKRFTSRHKMKMIAHWKRNQSTSNEIAICAPVDLSNDKQTLVLTTLRLLHKFLRRPIPLRVQLCARDFLTSRSSLQKSFSARQSKAFRFGAVSRRGEKTLLAAFAASR